MFDFYRLKNGVRVILVPMGGVQSVAVGTYVATGSRYETKEINGMSHFLEHMVFKGTVKFPTYKETSYLEGLGAIQNAWTSVDATAYWCKIPADKWREALEMCKELALNPTIPEKELEIERGVVLEEMHRRDDRPDELVGEEMQKIMFEKNPLGMTTLGEEEVIKRVKREDFLEYHSRQYVSGRMVVAVAGNLGGEKQRGEMKKQIEEWFGGLPEAVGNNFEPLGGVRGVPAIKISSKRQAAQAHLQIGFRGTSVTDPRRFASQILAFYLGHGLSSRLFSEVREKRGLCYAISADEDRLSDTGIWAVYAGLRSDSLVEAVKAIIKELERTKEKKMSEEELLQTKEKIRGLLIFSMENPVAQMEFFAKQALEKPEEIMTHDEVINRLLQISSEEIQKVAQSIFLIDNMNLAVVGPVGDKIKSELEKVIKM